MLRFALALSLPALAMGDGRSLPVCDVAECCTPVKCDDASITCPAPTVKIAAASTTDAGPIDGRSSKCCAQPCSVWAAAGGACPTATHTKMAGSFPGASTAECCAPIMCSDDAIVSCATGTTKIATAATVAAGAPASRQSTCCVTTCRGWTTGAVSCPPESHTPKPLDTVGASASECCTLVMCSEPTVKCGPRSIKITTVNKAGVKLAHQANCCLDTCEKWIAAVDKRGKRVNQCPVQTHVETLTPATTTVVSGCCTAITCDTFTCAAGSKKIDKATTTAAGAPQFRQSNCCISTCDGNSVHGPAWGAKACDLDTHVQKAGTTPLSEGCCAAIMCDDATISCALNTGPIAAAATTAAGAPAVRQATCCAPTCSGWGGTCPDSHVSKVAATLGASAAACCAPVLCNTVTCGAGTIAKLPGFSARVRGPAATAQATCCTGQCAEAVTCGMVRCIDAAAARWLWSL
jgi:hypothetical protein